MARIGYLMLHEGNWNGTQVISRDWARRSVQVVTPLGEMHPVERRDSYYGYGHMWWVFDGPRAVGPFKGADTAIGAWGQWISAFPAIDLVVAHKTNDIYGRQTSTESWQRIIELVLEAKGVKMPGPYPWAPKAAGGGAERDR
jgi:CubicO group peptidase (beta-lactamase class C family)